MIGPVDCRTRSFGAERIDSKRLELEFAAELSALDARAAQIPTPSTDGASALAAPPSDGDGAGSRSTKGRGRRNLGALNLPEGRVEISDPV
jgi:hypothetical protein